MGEESAEHGSLRGESVRTVTGRDTRASTAFTLDVPAYKQVFIWVWVDLDGDGYVNQRDEAGGLTGPWYTDTTRDDLMITLEPAFDPDSFAPTREP